MSSCISAGFVHKAMKSRFREEQIARFGNNIISYPSLKRCDFEKVISLELSRLSTEFLEISGVSLWFSDKLKRLICSEGVYPVHGVRPVLSSIGSFISPKLSNILIEAEDNNFTEATFDVLEDSFDVDEVSLKF